MQEKRAKVQLLRSPLEFQNPPSIPDPTQRQPPCSHQPGHLPQGQVRDGTPVHVLVPMRLSISAPPLSLLHPQPTPEKFPPRLFCVIRSASCSLSFLSHFDLMKCNC